MNDTIKDNRNNRALLVDAHPFKQSERKAQEVRSVMRQYSPAGHRPASNPLPRWKRALDVACILFALPAVLPLMALIALAIRICSRGPVIFRQERIGLFGEPFVCLKFRTMKVEAKTSCHEVHLEKLIRSAGPMTKLDATGDARVIPVGGFLRATGLDELPQLINVLQGEMSLIGPRPCIRFEYDRFRPQDRARFNAVPGLTGLWQVSGKNGTTFQQMIDLDIEYAQNLSLARDLKILWRTWPVLLQQAQAHRRTRVPSEGQPARPPGNSSLPLRPNQKLQ